MAEVTGDRVLETTVTTGTGAITLAGAVSGYRAFSAVATADADTFYYTIALGTEWEVGLGTRTSASTFARTTVIASSNAGAAVSFSAGAKEVWMDIPARLAQLFRKSINPNFVNGTIVESHAGGAVTYAVKTLAGANPTAADPVFFVFAATDGSTYYRVVTAALAITIASGATMGAPSAKGFRIWLAALDNAGTVELAVRNCCDQTNGDISWFDFGENRFSTTVQAGGGDDLALVTYSVTARTNVPFIALGNYTYTSLTTAGTWDASPATINLFSLNTKKPGDVIATYQSTANTAVSATTSTYLDTPLTKTVTPKSVAHMIRVRVNGGVIVSSASTSISQLRIRNTTQSVNIGGAAPQIVTSSTGGLDTPAAMAGFQFPSSLSAQTYTVQVAQFGTGLASFSDGSDAHMQIDEIAT